MSKVFTNIVKETHTLIINIATLEKRVYRAPQDYMYEVKGVLFVAAGAASNWVALYDKELQEEITTMDITKNTEGMIAFFNMNTETTFYVPTHDYTCKFISAIFHNTVSTRAIINVYYDLIPANKSRLIYEYVKNSRMR